MKNRRKTMNNEELRDFLVCQSAVDLEFFMEDILAGSYNGRREEYLSHMRIYMERYTKEIVLMAQKRTKREIYKTYEKKLMEVLHSIQDENVINSLSELKDSKDSKKDDDEDIFAVNEDADNLFEFEKEDKDDKTVYELPDLECPIDDDEYIDIEDEDDLFFDDREEDVEEKQDEDGVTFEELSECENDKVDCVDDKLLEKEEEKEDEKKGDKKKKKLLH